MKVLNEHSLGEEWFEHSTMVGGNDLNVFIGKVIAETAHVESEIINLLYNVGKKTKRFIGGNIELFIEYVKKDIPEMLEIDHNFEKKFKDLNKIRVFVAHGLPFSDMREMENPLILLKDDKNGKPQGLIIDDALEKEFEDLSQDCFRFTAQIQIKLGYLDDILK